MLQPLNYPFDSNQISKKKKSLKRELLSQERSFLEKRIAILGGSTTAEIKDVLELFLLKEGIKPIFYESEYNKYYEDIAFDNESLAAFKPELIYIHTTVRNISRFPSIHDSKESVQELLSSELARFTFLWQKIRSSFDCPVIQNNFEHPPERSLGNLDCYDFRGKSYFVSQLNQEFARYAQENRAFHINDIHYLSSWFGLSRWHDRAFWHSYKYALSYDAVAPLAHNIARIVAAIYGKSKKALVVDLDNTLWGGVIGDDGINGLQLGSETALAEAYSAFQAYVKTLKERGVILAVCSKNSTESAREGFSHPDSILATGDFASFRANWEPKHLNIAAIAEELGIGLDSLVFVDDNPAERELVQTQLPQVQVPNVGSDIAHFIEHLENGAYFETVSISSDDLERSRFYEENTARDRQKAEFANYGEFLRSLQMSAEIKPFAPVYLDRIAQLVNKTNQFNLTLKRYSMAEVEAMAADEASVTLYGRLSDKFGDNGLVSVVAGKVKDKSLHIDLWLMSCRVLKRDMELAMFDELVNRCNQRGVKELLGYFYKGPKNGMVLEHYSGLGFELVTRNENGDTVWRYRIPSQYASKNTFVALT